MLYCTNYSMIQSLYLSTSNFTATLLIKFSNISQNISATANQLRTPTRRNSRPAQTRTNDICQRKALPARTQPRRGLRTQNGTKKTYQRKPSLEATKTSMTELLDAQTHARALKHRQKALALRAQGQLSYSKACHTKRKTYRRTHCH